MGIEAIWWKWRILRTLELEQKKYTEKWYEGSSQTEQALVCMDLI